MIPVNGLKGELLAWVMYKRSAFGRLQTMGDYSSIVTVKAFASKEMTDEDFSLGLANLAKGVFVTLDGLIQAEPVSNNKGEKLKHPDSGREIYQHYLRIRDIALISPAYRLAASVQGSEDQAPSHHSEHSDNEYSEQSRSGTSVSSAPTQVAIVKASMPPMPAMLAQTAKVPWETMGT